MRTALIDGDTLIYEASSMSEYECDLGDDQWTLTADLGEARRTFDGKVQAIIDALDADRVIIALSDRTRWRSEVMPTYKSNRAKTRKPIVYRPLRDYCHEAYTTFQRPTLEGDDVLGILATHPTYLRGEKIIVAIDKDMKTIPGEHYNYQREERFTVSESEADFAHMMQTLTGDATDGYPGCPGVGPVKAAQWLSTTGDLWPRVVAAYTKAGLTEADALCNARVARILRHTDYDFDNKRVILWNPPASSSSPSVAA